MLLLMIIMVLCVFIGFLLRNKYVAISYIVIAYSLFGNNITKILQSTIFYQLNNTQKILLADPILTIILFATIFSIIEILFIRKVNIKLTKINSLLLILFIMLSAVFIIRYIPGSIEYYYINAFIPLCLFFYTSNAMVSDRSLERITRYFIFITTGFALYGIFEYVNGSNILYKYMEEYYYYETYDEFSKLQPYRIFSFTSHPLQLSSFLIMSMALLLFFKEKLKVVNVIQIGIIFIAIILTFSRMALFIMLLMVITYIFMKNKANKKIVILSSVIFIPILVFYLKDDILFRFISGANSTTARLMGIKVLDYISTTNIFIGYGFTYSREFVWKALKYSSSIEIPWVIQIIDYGILTTALYVSTIIFIMFNFIKRRYSISWQYFLPLMFLLMQLSVFNGLVESTGISILLWYFTGIFYSNYSSHLTLNNKIMLQQYKLNSRAKI